MKAQEVIIGSGGGCGQVTLNRPKAINALNIGMCRTIIAALQSWEFDPEIAAIIIDHSDGRGFCAGGDLRALYENIRIGGNEVLDFFRTEYRLDHLLFTLAKPSVCFMDGIVMGGGAGIAMPCRYRVATESTVFAMPETGIGFFPDVGAGWFLSRLPDRIGQWLALTGAKLDGADCLRLGLATHFLPRSELASVKARIQKAPDELEVILSDASVSPPPARIDMFHTDIDRLFAADRIEDIFAVLNADPSPWAGEQLAAIRKKSPRSCKVALRALAEGRMLTQFSEIMQLEYRVSSRLARKPDFSEGVRAFVIDKDDRPKWLPPRFEDVSDDEIDAIFAPLPENGEWTPLKRE
ncbi:MAG: enoyl-CoA hydratase/isomerase family protein [Aestuariivirga sp.]|nr:enoyl-CoA hydratase/isomerase family protein [Aestuariivirga sp.]